jgi:hypothetical protein
MPKALSRWYLSLVHCFKCHREAHDRSNALQHQLIGTRSQCQIICSIRAQFDAQNADVYSLQDELKARQVVQELYSQMAETPQARCRRFFVSPNRVQC